MDACVLLGNMIDIFKTTDIFFEELNWSITQKLNLIKKKEKNYNNNEN